MAKINDEYDIGAAFEAIENELIASMIRNFEDHKLEEIDEKKRWSMWQTEMLHSLEKYKHDNQKKYGKQFKDINKKIEVLISLARSEGGMNQEKRILEAIKNGFPAKRIIKGGAAEFFKINDRKLEALIKATTDDMQKAETAVLRMANDQYRKIIYNAQVYANTGAGTYEKAVDMASKDFLSAGLNCIEYANGARHTIADYADMAVRTASKRAYLQGEGEMRQQWGLHLVIMNKRGDNPCPQCLPFVGKIMIDDVWSGGSRKDGNYPLMSSAVEAGLYHPRCRDAHTTYFPGITKVDSKYNKQEIVDLEEQAQQEARQQYAERQVKRYGRLEENSLDSENQRKYEQKQKEWKHVRMRTGGMNSREYAESKRSLTDFRAVPQDQVVDILRKESEEWINALSREEKHAIGKYTFNSGDKKPNRFFERLNAMLRGEIPEDKKLRDYTEIISGALRKNKLKQDVICYRNMEFNPYEKYPAGTVFVDDQFISTSIIQKAALSKQFKMIFLVPKGSRGAYIERVSKYPRQREFLLDKECKMRILSKQKDSILVEVIP